MSITSGILEERSFFFKENESICDELNQSSRSLYKHSKQVETDHKNEKAILQQKVDILQMQLQEFEQRETSLKKMNADIMSALTDLNKKEDFSLRNKVFEELELANQEKLREKQQQKSKIQAIKVKMGLQIDKLKEKLEESENKRKEMELNLEKEKIKFQREVEQEQRKTQDVKTELETEKSKGKAANQNEKLRKKISQLEDENQSLKKHHEAELNKMTSEFEKNLSELKEIHNEEKLGFEDRMKKLKEELSKSEKENENYKTNVEEQLNSDINSLKDQLLENEANYNKQVENLISERDKAYQRFDELQKSLKELSNILIKESRLLNSSSVYNQSQPQNQQALAFLNKIINMAHHNSEPENLKPIIGDGIEAIDHLPSHCPTESAVSFLDMDPLAQSLACSIIQEPLMEQKRQKHQRDQSRSSWKDIVSKLPIRNSVKPYGYNPEGDALHNSTVSYMDFENQKPDLTKKHLKPQQQYQGKSKNFMATKENNHASEYSLQASNAGKLAWILKDISHMRDNSHDEVEKLIKHDRSGSTDIVDLSHISRGATIQEGRYDRRQVNEVPTKVRYSNTIEVAGRHPSENRSMLENNSGAIDWKDIFNARKVRESGNSSSRKSFHNGIQDVMHGLSSIKNRLERQQENILNVKNESLRERSFVKPRSYSNVGVKVDSNKTTIESYSRNNSQVKLFNNPLTDISKLNTSMNRNEVTNTEQNSFYGLTDTSYLGISGGLGHERSSSFYNQDVVRNFKQSYRAKTPIIVRESLNPNKYSYGVNRHRNSLV